MRQHAAPTAPTAPATPLSAERPAVSDWLTLQRLFPYLWEYKWRVLAALSFMVLAKLANVGVPVLLKELVDALTPKPDVPQALWVVPMALLLLFAAGPAAHGWINWP